LLLSIVALQVAYVVYISFPMDDTESLTVDTETQDRINALKASSIEKDSVKIYPFNPNFITDYKGYTLGMSVAEIDRLHSFRATDRYVNSPEDFQKVTHVSDALLSTISPYFKFPDWTQKSRQSSGSNDHYKAERGGSTPSEGLREVIAVKDLNSATAEDLKQISGIGEKLSARIIKFRDRLGGFLVDEQLKDVYGLEPQVVDRALQRFRVIEVPLIQKINLNSATSEELQKLIYLQRNVSMGIVNYRNDNGTIVSFDELSKIPGFPVEKIDRIALYLSL